MKTAMRCARCKQIYIQEGTDGMLEFDFVEQKISYFCQIEHNGKKCGHENVIDFGGWVKEQQKSGLPLPKFL